MMLLGSLSHQPVGIFDRTDVRCTFDIDAV
jgi:hypothetical protein